MKKVFFLAVMAFVMMGVAFLSCNSQTTVRLKSDIDSVCYTIGQLQGSNYKKQTERMVENWPVKGNVEAVVAGFLYGMNHVDDSLFLGRVMQEATAYLDAYFNNIQEKMSEVTREEANKFLAENKGKPGVITTESGLQYKVITEGKGRKVTIDDVVKVHYHGTLLNGEVFDSSVQNNQPAEFPVGGVIEGFKEGLQLLSVGSKILLWIPPNLGYNMDPNNPYFGKLLTFELELLEIMK